jgi:hypothetical protein
LVQISMRISMNSASDSAAMPTTHSSWEQRPPP